ncbi:MAG TPA: carbon monoxide dehydrogenase subunit G [Longimicrobiales bacterium]|nr:carbon monoxide dehydrogenase subunit G [Longimicrobiales bacterium]
MKVQGDHLFEGPQELVWETLLDPEVLASVLPGCEKLELVGENEYEGELKIKMGPVQGTFMGKVKLEDIQRPDSYTMQVDGRGAPGFVKATGHLSLEPEDDRTRVSYEGDAQVGGRLASVGQRLVESSAKAIIKQSLDGLNEAVKERAAPGVGAAGEDAGGTAPAGDGPAPAASRKPPSQASFAANVAKDVVRDVVPAPVRYGAVALVVIVVLLLLYVVMT